MGGIPWAEVVALVHAAVVVLVLGGGFAAWRWPALRRVHVPVLAAAAAVNLAGSPCPLTVLELRLRAAEGRAPYSGGFLGHYVVEPLVGAGPVPALPGLLCAAAVLPNVVAYGVPLARRLLARAAPARAAGQWLVVPRRDSSRAGTSRSVTSPVASE